MRIAVLDPLTHTLDIVEELLAEGRKEEALQLLSRVNDALEQRATQLGALPPRREWSP